MKLGYGLLAVFVCLTVVFGGMYLKARAEVQPVYDVLSIDERIAELRSSKFDICKRINNVDLDKLDQIVKTCGSNLQLK